MDEKRKNLVRWVFVLLVIAVCIYAIALSVSSHLSL